MHKVYALVNCKIAGLSVRYYKTSIGFICAQYRIEYILSLKLQYYAGHSVSPLKNFPDIGLR